jgi:pyruvate dehydrogenase E1 component alpha subunit
LADSDDTSEVRTPAGVLSSSRGQELPDPDTSRELLRQMVLIRRFEEEAGRQYQRAKAGGFLHLAIGEEATIVGTTSLMEPGDYLIGTYRTHGHAIARGTDPRNVMAELFGREDGTARGRGGSMHIFDGDRRFMGGYGIVGGNLPIAAGLALASDYKGTDEVTVCMFGDGATNTGNFGETINLAALWSLPIVFLVENNLYGMGTAIERHSAVTDLSHKAEGLGVPGERVDGQDVVAMRECVADHLEIAREERRPTLVEAFTYRYRGHSAADPEVYRDKHEVEEWQRRDPIEVFARRLIDSGAIDADELDRIREEVDGQVTDAVEFADASPEPPLDSLYDNLYVFEGEHVGWYAVDERTPDAFRGEREREAAEDERVRELHEAGASYGGQSPRSGGGSGEGPETETDAPADRAQSEEEDELDVPDDEQSEESRQQGPGGIW